MKQTLLLASLCSLFISCSTLFSTDEVANEEATKETVISETSSQESPQPPPNSSLDLNSTLDQEKSDKTTLTPQEASAAEDEEFGQAMSDKQAPPLIAMKDQRISTDELNTVQAPAATDINFQLENPPSDHTDVKNKVEENNSYLPTPSPKSQMFSRFRGDTSYEPNHHRHKHLAKKSVKALASKHKAKNSRLLAKKLKKSKAVAKHEHRKTKNLAQKGTKSVCKKVAKHSKKSKREIAMCRVDKLPPKLAHKNKKLNRMAASQASSRYR